MCDSPDSKGWLGFIKWGGKEGFLTFLDTRKGNREDKAGGTRGREREREREMWAVCECQDWVALE